MEALPCKQLVQVCPLSDKARSNFSIVYDVVYQRPKSVCRVVI